GRCPARAPGASRRRGLRDHRHESDSYRGASPVVPCSGRERAGADEQVIALRNRAGAVPVDREPQGARGRGRRWPASALVRRADRPRHRRDPIGVDFAAAFLAWLGASTVLLADGRRGLAAGMALAALGLAGVCLPVGGPLVAAFVLAGGAVAAARRAMVGPAGGGGEASPLAAGARTEPRAGGPPLSGGARLGSCL